MSEPLRLAAPTGIAETILIRAVSELIQRDSALLVEVQDGTTKDLPEFLKNGKAELTLQGKDIAKKGEIETHKLPHEEENVLIMSVREKWAPKDDLTDNDYREILTTRMLIGRFEGAAVDEVCREVVKEIGVSDEELMTRRFTVRSLEGCVRAVAAGIGVVILPKGTAEEICPRQIKAFPLPPVEHQMRKFYVAWCHGHALSQPARDLCGILGVQDLP